MRKPEEKKKRKKKERKKGKMDATLLHDCSQLSLANSTYGKLRQHRTTAIVEPIK